MKLNLVLLALLQQARCAQQAVDPAELQLSLQAQHLDAWVERIAAKRNVSKDAVRSNVQAVTYHLDPAGQDAGSSAGRPRPKLDRRQLIEDYPEVLGNEILNDHVTQNRIVLYHIHCRDNMDNPPGTPYTPNHGVRSFWRATSGKCRRNTVLMYCKLPDDYGPEDWNQNDHKNLHQKSMPCGAGRECALFNGFNFSLNRPVSWGSCVSERRTNRTEVVNAVQEYFEIYECPMSPGTMREWDIYGESDDSQYIDWTAFTGFAREPLSYSHSPTFLFGKRVQWRGRDPDYQPWLKFARLRSPATIRLYSHLW